MVFIMVLIVNSSIYCDLNSYSCLHKIADIKQGTIMDGCAICNVSDAILLVFIKKNGKFSLELAIKAITL